MDSGDGWSFLPNGIVDRIVAELKQRRCWRRDGRALRLLNKHWCLQVSQHILDIKPHYSRQLERRDIASLKKFPQLTFLDASGFVKNGGANAMVEAITTLKKLE